MRDNYVKKQKKKEFVMILLVCMVCLSAIIMGTQALSKKGNKADDDTQKIVDLNETKKGYNQPDSEEQGQDVNGQVNKQTQEQTTTKNKVTEKYTSNTEETTSKQPETQKEASSPVDNLSFGKESTIAWPVMGNIILDYNMENTIYFPTLNSYKCNPAVVIQSDNGTNVCAGVKGYVKTVGTDSEIGNYVVLSIGSGYELTYGQLKDICVSEGQLLDSTTVIGNISDPTKYYVKEGYNLYFKVTQDGVPVDPLDYLQ